MLCARIIRTNNVFVCFYIPYYGEVAFGADEKLSAGLDGVEVSLFFSSQALPASVSGIRRIEFECSASPAVSTVRSRSGEIVLKQVDGKSVILKL